MDHIIHPSLYPNHVTALFRDHEQSFCLVRGTTVAQFAEMLADMAHQNHAWPVSVSVAFALTSATANNAHSIPPHGETATGAFQ